MVTSASSGPAQDSKIFHDLMPFRVREILLVLPPFDAFVLEGDGLFASRIIQEYSGLNLSRPPRVTRVETGVEGLAAVRRKRFDLVITAPYLSDMAAPEFAHAVKEHAPDLPVIVLAHSLAGVPTDLAGKEGIDNLYVWTTGPELLLALIKSVEDRANAAHDTLTAMVRVLLFVEDSPVYRSRFLPLLYREVMRQTQAVLEESLNEEHRLLKMRARPKILSAATFEEAMDLYGAFRPYLFGVVADTRIPRQGRLDEQAGIDLLARIRAEEPDLPLLLLSAESANRSRAEAVPAVFCDKNDSGPDAAIQRFFLEQLGFGDFVFRMPDGREVGRAGSLSALEKAVADIPEESLAFHATRNHFSTWAMARSEIALASSLSRRQIPFQAGTDPLRAYVRQAVREARGARQRGMVVRFRRDDFDATVTEFVKIGHGYMGGKAVGLAFMADLFRRVRVGKSFPEVSVRIPRTCVLATDAFDSFVEANGLSRLSTAGSDMETTAACLAAPLPAPLLADLAVYLDAVRVPLAVRSSSMLEDVRGRPFAGLFRSFFIPNSHPDPAVRLRELADAVRLVYASAFFVGPRAYAGGSAGAADHGMAVIIQEAAGRSCGEFFYPAMGGVARSHNFYPLPPMRPEDGVAHVALGFGQTVMAGGRALAFCPRHPEVLPQLAVPEEAAAAGQRDFFALRMAGGAGFLPGLPGNLERRSVAAAADEYPVMMLTSAYDAEEGRIRDGSGPGPRLVTFAQVLKHRAFPLAGLLDELLGLCRSGMGGPVDIEFAADFAEGGQPAEFHFLQARRMATASMGGQVVISEADERDAFLSSGLALGHGTVDDVADIVVVKPFPREPGRVRDIAREIHALNARLEGEGRPYLLAGPGRWGSADPWLGIPVRWQDISGVRVMVELLEGHASPEPSQGTHFFQNIVARGIVYVTIRGEKKGDRYRPALLERFPAAAETAHLRHVRLAAPLVLKADGIHRRCVARLPER